MFGHFMDFEKVTTGNTALELTTAKNHWPKFRINIPKTMFPLFFPKQLSIYTKNLKK